MMKVIDKRTENDEWRVGDVICLGAVGFVEDISNE